VARGRLLRHQGGRDRDVEGDRQGGRQARHHAQRRLPRLHARRPEASGEHSIWQGEQGAQFDDEILKKVARSYPLRRLGTPEDIVGRSCCSPPTARPYITGQTLSVSGGYTML
jgi:NAD(P)-dependent dehydrogenase (short-subunit alcohol dehydrogenase family)